MGSPDRDSGLSEEIIRPRDVFAEIRSAMLDDEAEPSYILPVAQDRFIPVSRAAIVDDLTSREELPPRERAAFADVTHIINMLFHYRLHSVQEALKRSYLPLAPKGDLFVGQALSGSERQALEAEVIERLDRLLRQANYVRLTSDELTHIFAQPSPFSVQVEVNPDDYDVLHCYYRGLRVEQVTRRGKLPPFRPRVVSWPTFARVTLIIRERGEDRLLLKLFCDVPQSALEMLLPRCRLSMKRSDRWQLAAIGASAVAGGAGIIHSAMAAATSAWLVLGMGGIWAGKVALGVRRARERYNANLISKLYYANLANNNGVIQELVDLAEEEESKEAILAYYFLRRAGGRLNMERLDQEIEAYLKTRFQATCDFETDDGIRKLVEDGLATIDEDGCTVTSVDCRQACELLDAQWDSLFGKTRTAERFASLAETPV